jgi:pimeloyl-ACP methyl ester carboxylesterase
LLLVQGLSGEAAEFQAAHLVGAANRITSYNRGEGSTMFYAYTFLSWLYLALPIAAAGFAIGVARKRAKAMPIWMLLRTCTTGTLIGGAVVVAYASLGDINIPFGQWLLACWMGISAMCAVSGLNWVLSRGVARIFRIDPKSGKGGRNWAQATAGILQAFLLMAIGLPFLGSLLILYRPKSPSPGTPLTLIDAPYQTVIFPATDGTSLEGWWIPATHNRRTDARGSVKWGHDTVLLCHGFGADKARDLFLAATLVANGYNILAIDLRAHGHSGGQFTGFGGIESRDVLGAVRWLREAHPAQSRRILGLGESLGAAALIEAASDPGPEGQSIDAIAAYNPYDQLSVLMNEVARQRSIPAGRWAFEHMVLPVASMQIGSDLAGVSPAKAVMSLWPRPILVLGNPMTRQVGGDRSYEFYRDAMQPKYAFWRDDAARDALLHDDTAALTVRIFFDEEQSIL